MTDTGTILFLDTEFTDLLAPKLIAFGLVSEHEIGPEYYCELLDGWTRADCSEFVLDVVLPLFDALPNQRRTRAEAALSLRDWLQRLPKPMTIVFDSEIDWILLTELAASWPSGVQPLLYQGSDCAAEERYHQLYQGRQHHALHDARALRAGWREAENL